MNCTNWRFKSLSGICFGALFLTIQFLTIQFLTTPALGNFFSPGSPNGWDNTTPMTETSAGSGIWEYSWSAQTQNPEGFDILSVSGDWNSKVYPSGNQWVTPDGSGGNTLSLDTNTYSDGWSPDTNRVGVATELDTSWTAVGNWQSQVGGGDWDNANANTLMSAAGSGIYSLSALISPGMYEYKAVSTGTWDAIGRGSRNVNSDNYVFTVPAGSTGTNFFVNVLNGTVKVENVPEPGTFCLLGLAFSSLVLTRARRR